MTLAIVIAVIAVVTVIAALVIGYRARSRSGSVLATKPGSSGEGRS